MVNSRIGQLTALGMVNEAWGAMLKEYHAGIMEANKSKAMRKRSNKNGNKWLIPE